MCLVCSTQIVAPRAESSNALPSITPPNDGACDQPQWQGCSVGNAVIRNASPAAQEVVVEDPRAEVVARQDQVGRDACCPGCRSCCPRKTSPTNPVAIETA